MVVFPPPEGPTRAMDLPAGMEKETWLKNRLAAVIAEAYVLIGNMALYICKGLRVRRILDLRFCFHDCQEALEAGKALLEHFRKLHQDLDGADENSDVEGVHGQVCWLHLPDGDKVSSGHQDGQIHHALEKQGACVEFSHGPVVIVPGSGRNSRCSFRTFSVRSLHWQRTGPHGSRTGYPGDWR